MSALSYLLSRLELMMVVLRSSANPRLILFVSSVGRIEVTALASFAGITRSLLELATGCKEIQQG
jgi:hypothetical protein